MNIRVLSFVSLILCLPCASALASSPLLTAAGTPAAVFTMAFLFLLFFGLVTGVVVLFRQLKNVWPVYRFHANVLQGVGIEAYCFHPLAKGKGIIMRGISLLFGEDSLKSWDDVLNTLREDGRQSLQHELKRLLQLATDTGEEQKASPGFQSILRTKKQENQPKKYLEVTARVVRSCQGKPQGVGVWFRDVTQQALKEKRLMMENKQLKEELRHFSNLLNAAPFPIWQRNQSLQIKYCNLAYTKIVEEEENEPLPNADVMELGKNTYFTARKAKESEQQQTERHAIIAGGERRMFEISEVPVPGENGVFAGFGRDISDVESLEKELHLNMEAQTCLLESSASAMALYGFDTRLKSYNNAFLKLWGLKDQWLATHPTYGEVLEACREKRKLPEQSNFPAFKKRHLRLFNELIEPYNEFFYLPDGTALRVIVIPHALGGLLFAYEDMTDRLAIERSYNTLIAVQRATLDNLYEGVAVFGQNGRIKLFNPTYTSMWRLDPRMLESEPHISHILDTTKALYPYGDDWVSYKENVITKATNQRSMQQRLERTDGTVLDWTCVPLPDGATLMTYIDVTDSTLVERSLRERNEALQGADRIKTEFLANVSYELRSPLTTILGFSEILQNQEDNLNKKQQEYIHAIYGSSLYLMTLINDILDLASIEAGYMTLDVEYFDVCEALHSVTPLVNERIKEKGLTFSIECNGSVGRMIGDDRRIRQCVFKLLSNAIKFTERGGSITLGAKALPGEKIVVWIADTGIGIAPEEQETVFQKFYKSDAARGRNSGTGLGLSVVKSFVTMHGGTIELESVPGTGTTFRCLFLRENPVLIQAVKNESVPVES